MDTMTKNHGKPISRLGMLLGLVGLAALTAGGHPLASARTDLGPIAYVRTNHSTGDEIHLIEANGQNDRILWNTGESTPSEIVDIQGLAWKPARGGDHRAIPRL